LRTPQDGLAPVHPASENRFDAVLTVGPDRRTLFKIDYMTITRVPTRTRS
jgi:hypothetical protein